MAERKKIMWLIKGLGAGGAEKLLTMSLPYLNLESFDYEVGYFLPWKNDLVPEFERAAIPVFCLENRAPVDPGLGLRLAKLLRQRKVDLLHIHLPYPAIFGRVAARVSGIKALVYTEHNLVQGYRPITRWFHRLTSPLDDATIAVSQEVYRSIMKSRAFKPRSEVRVIYGGIDLSQVNGDGQSVAATRASLGIPQGHFVVGNVANLRPEKGYGYFLEAARQILDQCPSTTFIIVGREKWTGDQQALETRAAELGIRERVIFTGFQPQPLPIMATFDVFLMSSLREGLPVALLEAMAMGKPPVATATGGVPEAVENTVDGFVVEPQNPSALAEKVLMLLRDDELRRRISQRAQKKVRDRFTVQRMVQDIEGVYATVLDRSRGGVLIRSGGDA